MTWLENGVLKVDLTRGNMTVCRYRCLYPANDWSDWNITETSWKPIENEKNTRPNCDIVETRCQENSTSKKDIYGFIHTQFVEKKPETPTNDGYNFYWITLDSVSHLSFKRPMTKTRDVLLNKMQAIEFPYLNKVGSGSVPNVYGMFFGEQTEKVEDKFPNDTINSRWRNPEELCNAPMENFDFVGHDFKKQGYRSMMVDDWFGSIVNYPNCIGFKKTPFDHCLRPFAMKIGNDDPSFVVDNWIEKQMLAQSCKMEHNYLLEQILGFDDSYKRKPKFLLTWFTQLAHNQNHILFGVDHEFADFFEKLNEKSKNSFIFFQADHGLRYGDLRNVPILGETEDDNPFLYVILPKKMRKNLKLVKRMKENSNGLVSQFDLYASAVQIAKFSNQWSSQTNFDQLPNSITDRDFIGSSIFHQMKQPRACYDLHIPKKYCICQEKMTNLNEPKLAAKIAQKIIDFINKELEKSTHKNDCLKHTLSSNFSIGLEEFVQKYDAKRILKAKFETLPGKALYQGTVELKEDGSIVLMDDKFPRLNSYNPQANCIPKIFLQNYCVCANKV